MDEPPIQPVSGTVVPRFAGPSTFVRLPELGDLDRCDVAILGIPFDSGVSFRPGRPVRPERDPPGLAHAPAAVPPDPRAGAVRTPARRGRRRRRLQPLRHRRVDRADRTRSRRSARAGRMRSSAWAATTRCSSRSSGRYAGSTVPSPWCTSTPISTPGTRTSVLRTPTARCFAEPPRKGCSETTPRCTWGSEGRCTPRRTWWTMRSFGFRTIRVEDVHREGVDGIVGESVNGSGTTRSTSRSTSTPSTLHTPRARVRPRSVDSRPVSC